MADTHPPSELDPSHENVAPSAAVRRPPRIPAAVRRTQWLRARWSMLLACSALAMGAFIKLTSELNEGELDAFDRTALQRIVALRVPGLNGPAVDLTALGSVTVLTLLCVFGCCLLYMHSDRVGAWQLAIAASGGGLVTTLLKHALTRARPNHVETLVEVSGYAYPSGHSLAAASVYLTLAIVACRHLRSRRVHIFVFGGALLLMCGIGLSRAYLGVHYPSDIAAGLLLGSGWSLLVSAVFSFVLALDT